MRPPLPDHERKDRRITFSVTAEERSQIEAKASGAGLPRPEYCRRAALRRELPRAIPEVSRATLVELGKIGTNLNQLTRLFHGLRQEARAGSVDEATGVLLGRADELQDELEELHDTLVRIAIEITP